MRIKCLARISFRTELFGPYALSHFFCNRRMNLPDLIVVDEPELGLHPYALNLIAALFKKASHHTQVLISTQSASFLDNFDAEDVVVVNRVGKESLF